VKKCGNAWVGEGAARSGTGTKGSPEA
jgi:hypothetical protein